MRALPSWVKKLKVKKLVAQFLKKILEWSFKITTQATKRPLQYKTKISVVHNTCKYLFIYMCIHLCTFFLQNYIERSTSSQLVLTSVVGYDTVL